MHVVKMSRTMTKRTSNEILNKQIDYLVGRALNSSRGKGWKVKHRRLSEPVETSQGWQFVCELGLAKEKGRGIGGEVEYKQWEQIKAMLSQAGNSAKFADCPWIASFEKESVSVRVVSDQSEESSITGVKTEAVSDERVLDWSDYHIPPELLESDEALAAHPAFSDLYDISPQIRTVLSAVQRAVETGGKSRYHSVLFGEPGCGKTSTLRGVEKLFGAGSVLHLDATSTTKAGIEKLFFSDLEQYPRLVFLEEAEKAPEDGLKIWLGALDDRGELRKVNFRQTLVRDIQILFFCTANNKKAFDGMMGTGSGEPGALSSRCVNEVYFPRPNEITLRKILDKEIDTKGGDRAWVTPCLELAKELGVADPRKVKAFLTGGKRLLDGSFQADQRAIRGIR
jgi:hypothetical protein